MPIDSGVPTAPAADTGPSWGQAVEIDLSQSINSDTVAQDIRQFRPSNPVLQHINGPTLQNTGIVKDGGVTELWETVYASIPNALAGYVTSGGIGLAITTPDGGQTIIYNKVVFSGSSYTISPVTTCRNTYQCPANADIFFQRYLVNGYCDCVPLSSGTAPTSALGLRIAPASSFGSNTNLVLDEFDVKTGVVYNTNTFSSGASSLPTSAYITRVGNTADGQATFANQINTYGITFATGQTLYFLSNSGRHKITDYVYSNQQYGPCYYIPSSGYYFVGGYVYNTSYYSTSPLTAWTLASSDIGATNRILGNSSTPLISSYVGPSGNAGTWQISPTGSPTSIGILSTVTSPSVSISNCKYICPYGSSGLATTTTTTTNQSYSTHINQFNSGGVTASTFKPDLIAPMGSIRVNSLTSYLNVSSINGSTGLIFFSSGPASFGTFLGGQLGAAINEFGDLPDTFINTINSSATTSFIFSLISTYCNDITSGSNKSTIFAYQRADGSWCFVDIWNPISSSVGSSYGSSILFNEISQNVVVTNDANGTIIDLNDSSVYLDLSTVISGSQVSSAVYGSGLLIQTGSSNKYSSSVYSAPYSSSIGYDYILPPIGLFTTGYDLFQGSSSAVYIITIVYALQSFTDPNKYDQLYSNQSNVPVVHTATYSGGLVSMLTTSALQLPGFASYNLANLIGSYISPAFGGSSGNFISLPMTGFILFGYYYCFDGRYIYVLNLSGGSTGTLVGQPQILVKTQGLTYLCVTPNEAVFYSSYDNSIWTFNGGRTVEKEKAFNQQGAITGGYYDVYESALFLTTNSGYLTQRDSILSKNAYPSAYTGGVPTANASSNGIYWSYVNSSGNLIFSKRTYNFVSGATTVPLIYQTCYYGPGNGMPMRVNRIAFHIYCSAGQIDTLSLTLSYKTTDNAGSSITGTTIIYPPGTTQTGGLTIQTPGPNGDGYAWVDWVPSNNYGVGMSLTVTDVSGSTTQKIAILDMIWYYSTETANPITGKVVGG